MSLSDTQIDALSGGVSRSEAAQHRRAAAHAFNTLTKPVRWWLRIGSVVSAIASVALMAPYVALAMLGDSLSKAPVDESQAWTALAVILGGLSIASFGRFSALMITHIADANLGHTLKRELVATISKAPLSWFSESSSGRIRKALEHDVRSMHYVVAHAQVETVAAVVNPLTGVAIAFWLDWKLGIVTLLPMSLYMVAYARMSKGQGQLMHRMNQVLGALSDAITELVDGIAVIKTFGRTGQAHERYRSANSAFGDFFGAWVQPMLRTDAIATMALAAPTTLLLVGGSGTWMYAQGWVSIGEVLTATLISMTLPFAIFTVSSGMMARDEANDAALRVLTTLEVPGLSEATQPKTPTNSCVEFDSVTFSYEPGHPVLKDFSLTMPAGSITALVGPSGSGKSTAAHLVPRFADPDQGRILIGGVDVRDLPSDELYKHVGFILQNVTMLRVSIRDNIRLAVPDATDEEIINAAKLAQIHEVILALPHGYDTIYGEQGALSGGEQQRISIARALLAQPSVVILDEATSFADPESEAQIQAALATLLADRTVLVIAHRLSTIRDVDQIVVLDDGEIVQCGTHSDLIQVAGPYQKLWQLHEGVRL